MRYEVMTTSELLNAADQDGGELVSALGSKIEEAEREITRLENTESEAVADLDRMLEDAQDEVVDLQREVDDLTKKIKAIGEMATL